MAQKSEVYEYDGWKFRYDYDKALVEVIGIADAEMIEEEKEWLAFHPHGNGLYGIEKDGTYVVDKVGLMRENWDSQDMRDCYLDELIYDMQEEIQYLVSDAEIEFLSTGYAV